MEKPGTSLISLMDVNCLLLLCRGITEQTSSGLLTTVSTVDQRTKGKTLRKMTRKNKVNKLHG